MTKSSHHYCELPEESGGLAKLPPNAPFRSKVFRYIRKLFSPNPNAALCKRKFRNQSQINAERRRHATSRYFYVIHPYSDMERFREIIFIFIGLWEFIMAPLNASFGHIWRKEIKKGLNIYAFYVIYFEKVVFGIELLWIFSCFFSAYKEKKTKVIQLNHLKIIQRYLITYFFIDVLFLSPPIDNEFYERWIHWLNFAIFLRSPTFVKFIKRFLMDLGASDYAITFIVLIYLSFFIVHVFVCVFYILPLHFNPKSTILWIVKSKLHPSTTILKVYLGCFSMIQTHFWGLGESQQKIEILTEQFVLTVVMIVGRLWSLYLLATMLRIFTISSFSESKYEEYLLQLKTFIAQKQLPKELEDRLLEYYQYKYQHHYFNEKAIFNAISHYLRKELLLYGARNVITKVKIFKYFPRSLIGSIIERCKVLIFMNNDVVVHEGDLIEFVYFLSYGTIAVFNKDGVEIAHLSDGEEIGIKGVVENAETFFPYSYTAIETCELYVISLRELRAIVFNKGDILKYFAKRVEDRLKEMRKIEILASATGVDLLSELHHGKVLERPRIRTRYFERST